MIRICIVLNVVLILGAMIHARDTTINRLNSDLAESKTEAVNYQRLYEKPGSLFTKNVKGPKGKTRFTTVHATSERDITVYDKSNSSGIDKFISDIQNDQTDINESVKITRKSPVAGSQHKSGLDAYALFKGLEQKNGFLSPAQAHNLILQDQSWFRQRVENGKRIPAIAVENEKGERYIVMSGKLPWNGKFYVDIYTLENVAHSNIYLCNSNFLMPV